MRRTVTLRGTQKYGGELRWEGENGCAKESENAHSARREYSGSDCRRGVVSHNSYAV